MNLELSIEFLGKRYGKLWALRDISFQAGKGVFGLLGSNGAGKSSLMRILSTLTLPTEGQVLWNQVDIVRYPNKLREVLGYLPQDFGVYPNLTSVEFLEYIAAAKGLGRKESIQRINDLLLLLNLDGVKDRPLRFFSGGMKQRVGIAQALLNDPKLLILDEPTSGLDPTERMNLRNLLSELAENRIVILSSHITTDLEAIAETIAVLDKGILLRIGDPKALRESVRGMVWEVEASDEQLPQLRQFYTICGVARRGHFIRVRLLAERRPESAVQEAEPTLEDAYIYVTRIERKQVSEYA